MADVYVTFPSLMNPTTHAYRFDSSAWKRDNAGVEAKFRMFQTYGDGMVQHSNDWAITYDYLGDYCASLAAYMLTHRPTAHAVNVEDPDLSDHERSMKELYRAIGYIVLERPRLESIEFAASVVWKESDDEFSKQRFYSLELKKITKDREKQHDKRFKRIERNDDGSAEAVLRMITPEHTDGVERLCYALAVKEWFDAQPKKWCESAPKMLGWWNEDPEIGKKRNILRYGFDALREVARSYQSELAAYSDLWNYTRNYLPKPEEQKQLPAETIEAA